MGLRGQMGQECLQRHDRQAWMCPEAVLSLGGTGMSSLLARWGVTSWLADLRGDHEICCLKDTVILVSVLMHMFLQQLRHKG